MNSRNDYASVPALEARHEWNGGAYILNDAQGDLPRLKCTAIGGLLSLGDVDLPVDQAFGRVGEIPRDGERRGKTVTYEGLLQASTLEAIRYQLGVLRAAFAGTTEKVMKVVPHPTYGGKTYFYRARCTLFDFREENVNFDPMRWPKFQIPGTIVLRASDPRIYSDETIQQQSALGSGAANVSVDVTNPGTAPADPIVRVTGPTTGFRISRGGGTLLAAKAAAAIAAGHYWDFNFRERRIYFDDGSVISNYLDSGASNFWDAGVEGLPSGDSTWTLSQAAGFPGINSRIRVSFSPANW